MSHEIRTPMNAVIGMTGLLLETDLDAEQRSFTEIVRSSGEGLLAVINDVLDFSKIEAGELVIEWAPVGIRDCVDDAVQLLAISADKRGVELSALVDPSVPVAIFGDSTRIQQTLVNLLGNAIKFTSDGEVAITVTARALADEDHFEIEFAVRDTGIGIAPEHLPRLFEPFAQEDASTTRRFGGSGLGLTICRRLAEAMGGRIWIESELGVGSTFHFTVTGRAAPYLRPGYLEVTQPRLIGTRVLVVDDNATNRGILEIQLESWGMQPTLVADGRAALKLLADGAKFDCAILDMHMPEMDGLELARRIRTTPSSAALPLIMLTSLGQRERSEAMENFAAFLTKPVKASRLYNVLLMLNDPAMAESDEVLPSPGDGPPLRTREDPDLPTSIRVLVAEDNSINQRVVLLSLQRFGYRADVAANGREAIEAIEAIDYDLVLMDVHMPELDGLEATRQIRANPRLHQPYIAALTANATVQDRDSCRAAGMDDYLSKPFRLRELGLVLRRYAEQATAVD